MRLNALKRQAVERQASWLQGKASKAISDPHPPDAFKRETSFDSSDFLVEGNLSFNVREDRLLYPGSLLPELG